MGIAASRPSGAAEEARGPPELPLESRRDAHDERVGRAGGDAGDGALNLPRPGAQCRNSMFWKNPLTKISKKK